MGKFSKDKRVLRNINYSKRVLKFKKSFKRSNRIFIIEKPKKKGLELDQPIN
jgi:hypothetical protein